MNEKNLKKKLSAAADQCVKCGLCLPHCPTYRERQDEADSPRGRIALIQGWAQGGLERNRRLDSHLAGCLECRACEAACPSLVSFGSLMDDARALGALESGAWQRRFTLAWLGALSSRLGARAAPALAMLYRASGAARLAERTGILRRPRLRALHRLALQLGRPAGLPEYLQPLLRGGDETHLFLGCVAQAAQPGALRAAHRVLLRLGFPVRVPSRQGCCGAMHRHNGFPRQANRLLARNASALAGHRGIGIASACVAELRTHPGTKGVQEACRALANAAWPRDVALHPLDTRVAVHEPCSHRNVLRDGEAAYELLRRIPDIDLVPLEHEPSCCGAAGTYLLQQPEMSQTLLAPKIERLRDLRVAILVTTNTGCALHLAAGAREAGVDLEVLHPIELIERQMVD